MIELIENELQFSFPEVHRYADMSIEFQRTFRIPDDGKTYSLPPGFGKFPLFHVDDYAESVSTSWIEHGGVMFPMHQSEALWINLVSYPHYTDHWEFSEYPFAIKIAAGKINALTGEPWNESLQNSPQDYLVSTEQPWLDGYSIKKDVIRQFVAMPLGAGYTAEEQLTGEAKHGGLQIIAYPMKKESYERLFPQIQEPPLWLPEDCCPFVDEPVSCANYEMGLAPGGRMKQEIYEDPFEMDDWDMDHKSRCYIHIANSLLWRTITGKEPPTVPVIASDYEKAGLPWFEYYDEQATPLDGSKKLAALESVVNMGIEKNDNPLPENETINPKNIVELGKGLRRNQIREGSF